MHARCAPMRKTLAELIGKNSLALGLAFMPARSLAHKQTLPRACPAASAAIVVVVRHRPPFRPRPSVRPSDRYSPRRAAGYRPIRLINAHDVTPTLTFHPFR